MSQGFAEMQNMKKFLFAPQISNSWKEAYIKPDCLLKKFVRHLQRSALLPHILLLAQRGAWREGPWLWKARVTEQSVVPTNAATVSSVLAEAIQVSHSRSSGWPQMEWFVTAWWTVMASGE